MNINEKAKVDWLTYANAVIKSRAIPMACDNLKPVHRRILYTLGEMKLTSDKKTTKCAKVVGACMTYHPHGDSSIYGALIRFSQWWKMRYPLVEVQGNKGNIIGDGPAAMRYTECKLSKVGDLMLEDISKDCVDFKPNYDESTQEPVFLPSKFPNLLCNGNTGIAVGLSCGLVPHNYNEVADAIEFYLEHQDCSISDLLQFIKGPDFPTGGKIVNGEEILAAYSTGRGVFKVQGNYTIEKMAGGKTKIVFTDVPYMTELENGIIKPIQKLVKEEGYTEFEDVYYEIVQGRPLVTIVLAKNADLREMLDLIFLKTRLATSVKMENCVIIDGEPKLLNLKGLIKNYVDHRSMILSRIANSDLEKTNHKLTVTLGLIKCLSNIDKLISLIRNADNRSVAKVSIMREFVLTDEQADAVLDMKLSRLSRLDVTELDKERDNLEGLAAKYRDIIGNEKTRYGIIKTQLEEMRSICGDDARLTKIEIDQENLPLDEMTEKWFIINEDGLAQDDKDITNKAIGKIKAKSSSEVYFYDAAGDLMTNKTATGCIGASTFGRKRYVAFVTKQGNVKVSSQSDYNFKKKGKGLKLKAGDELIYSGEMDASDYLLLIDDNNRALKLPFEQLSVTGKLTQGVKSGFEVVKNALVVSDNDILLMVNSDNKAKLTAVKDFTSDSRGTKGQAIAEDTEWIVKATDRESFFVIPSAGKYLEVASTKLSVKSKTAQGANITNRKIIRVI